MRDTIEAFFRGRGPVLLALSGGPDSMALFHLMQGLPFEVAHVDHGWRESSGEEAEQLRTLCGSMPFHLKKLSMEGNNLEDRARKMRLAFFKQVLEERGLEAVVMGHHADDQAETVLKRVLEGARLTKLAGLYSETIVEGVKILRPLLPFRKKEILNFIKGRLYFEDSTNKDTRFLRSRMRQEILPGLSAAFGKEVEPSLCRLADYAKELREFLEPYMCQGSTLDLSKNPPASLFLWKAVVSNFLEKKRITASAPTLTMICEHLRKQSCHKKMRLGTHEVTMHRGILTANKRIELE